ncbi:LTXXQ domain protein [Pseudomonas lalucatii]|uniref:LTXXQ domain protein n=1 Tax=Pseudomonas lalucatii TaxID=1424203 RepID=A0ABS5PWW7_9PSED|nr:Spy/CpxP family protein refolding chaperone [Pseudomonas lalucatii]MBS7660972.1 LTXXQ domain protein [Pseudomonas lalucatii]MBS7724355.1 LTXXQ domain protein [Pseudomonas lalucatii]QVM87657.1 LTXXQ domain protein [Pseudomonas lalucatii]
MRKTLTAVLLALTLPSLALAMPEGGPRHGGEHGMRLFKELDLSKAQQREMRQLMGEQMKNRHAITQRYLDKLPAAERKALQDELKAAREQQHDAMRALLEPEQQEAFDAHLKKMQERRAEREAFMTWKAEQAQKAE